MREQVRFGGLGCLGAILFVNNNKRIAGKLRRIILLLFGLATFRIHYWEIREPFIFVFFGPGGRDHDAPNQLFLI